MQINLRVMNDQFTEYLLVKNLPIFFQADKNVQIGINTFYVTAWLMFNIIYFCCFRYCLYSSKLSNPGLKVAQLKLVI